MTMQYRAGSLAAQTIITNVTQLLKALTTSGLAKTGAPLAKKALGAAKKVAGPAGLVGSGAAMAGAFGNGSGGNGVAPAMNGNGPSGASAPAIYWWTTGTAVFYRLQNGKIGTWKKNGVWKEWRPYKPVVIPRKWSSKAMGRVSRALKRQQKTAIDIVKMTGGDASKSRRSTTRTKGMRYDGKDVTMYRN